jgi:hypothetical protein
MDYTRVRDTRYLERVEPLRKNTDPPSRTIPITQIFARSYEHKNIVRRRGRRSFVRKNVRTSPIDVKPRNRRPPRVLERSLPIPE